jgi:Phage Mu protein F like protein
VSSKVFNKSRAEQLDRYSRVSLELRNSIVQLLQAALVDIEAKLGGDISEFERNRLPALRLELQTVLGVFQRASTDELKRGVLTVWNLGQDLVNVPLLNAIGVRMAPLVSLQTVVATQVFLTEKITDITQGIKRVVDAELGLIATGVRNQASAIDTIANAMGAQRDRALTIVRTEVGRVYSTATQMSMEQAVDQGVEMQKEWRKSNKRHPRASHNAANVQTVDVDESFWVGGEAMRFPRDPKASAKNTINCGCTLLPALKEENS